MTTNTDPLHINPGHATVKVRGVDIDEQLAPLIALLWGLGISTFGSCQAAHDAYGSEVATISFHTLENATQFIRLLATANPAYADDLMFLSDYPSDNGFRVYVWFEGSTEPGEEYLSPTTVVEFPTAKITELTAGVRAHLARIVNLNNLERPPLRKVQR